MKRTRIWTLGVVMLGMGAMIAGSATAGPYRQEVSKQQLRKEPLPHRGVQIKVWTDVGEGGSVYPGESVRVSFRTNCNAYVRIINIDTQGRRTVLFPEAYDDGFVRGGKKVKLGGKRSGYRLVVDGPRGTERIVALASRTPFGHRYNDVSVHVPGNGDYDDDYNDDGYDDYDDGYDRGYGVIHPTGGDNWKQQDLRVQRISKRPRAVARDETWFRVRGRRGGWCPW